MRHDLTDDHVLRFALAGCNAHEVATYAGTPEPVAAARMARVLAAYHARTARVRAKTEEQNA